MESSNCAALSIAFLLQTLLKAPLDFTWWKSWQVPASGSKPYLFLHPGFRYGRVWYTVPLDILLVVSHQVRFYTCQGRTNHTFINSPTRQIKPPWREPFPCFGCLGNFNWAEKLVNNNVWRNPKWSRLKCCTFRTLIQRTRQNRHWWEVACKSLHPLRTKVVLRKNQSNIF